ncbi:FecR domain-containing protein [bacterium]|nr:FecR domain-containing protein [bacterium]
MERQGRKGEREKGRKLNRELQGKGCPLSLSPFLPFSLILALAFLPPNPVYAAELLTGKLADVRGEVEVQKRGSREWVRGTSGMVVSPGDQVNTGLGGSASLVFKNSVTEIRPLTQFVVGRAFEDAKTVNTELFLQIGKVVSNVDPKSAKGNRFTVTTPTAVAGVRGTRQECGYSAGFGTEVKIENGEGYMSPVRAEKLPPAVQAMLGVAPAGGERAGGVGRGDEKRADAPGRDVPGAAETPKTVAEAVEAFNQWMDASEAALSEDAAAPEEGVALELDPGSLDYVVEIGDGLTGSVTDADDPTAVEDPLTALVEDAAPSVLPDGLTDAEEFAALISTEIVDEPVGVTSLEDQEEFAAELEALISTGVVTITPPDRPSQGQSQGQ